MMKIVLGYLALIAAIVITPAIAQEPATDLEDDYQAAKSCASQALVLATLFAENRDESIAETAEANRDHYKSLGFHFLVTALEIGSSLGKSQKEAGTELGQNLYETQQRFDAARRQRSQDFLDNMFSAVDDCRERFGAEGKLDQ